MGQGCQGDLACSQGQRWSLSAYMGGKRGVGREGDTPGGFTRVIQSRLPLSKKSREGKEKTSTGLSKTRGKKGRTLSSPEWASLFSLSLLFLFSPFLSHFYPKSFSFSLISVFLSFFFMFSLSHHPLPIRLTQTCFPGPAIHRYRIHQQ